MPIARRFDTFTLNVSRTDIAASIEVASEDETTNNLLPGDSYNVDWTYSLGRPRLGNANELTAAGTALTSAEQNTFATDFEGGWEGTVEGQAISTSQTAKFPNLRFGHDTPNIGTIIDPLAKIPNSASGAIPSEETLFGDSTLVTTSPLKGTAKFKGWIFCDQVWQEEINAPDPIDF